MKYKTNQYSRLIEPILYTKPFTELGKSIQVLENIVNREKKELEFESGLYYYIGEQIIVGNGTFTIENIIKPIDEKDYIELILEDEIIYCESYHEKAEKLLSEFESKHNYEEIKILI